MSIVDTCSALRHNFNMSDQSSNINEVNDNDIECEEVELNVSDEEDDDDINEYDIKLPEGILKELNENDSDSAITEVPANREDINKKHKYDDDTVVAINDGLLHLTARVNDIYKQMNGLKTKITSLENMMKTVLEKEKILNLKSKEPRKRCKRNSNTNTNGDSNENKNATIGENAEGSAMDVSKISPMSNYLCVSNAPKYTCSLTQGVRSADVFFEGDFVVHLGDKHGGSKIGKIIKVFKKSVHVRTDPYAKDHHTWLIADIAKCNRFGDTNK